MIFSPDCGSPDAGGDLFAKRNVGTVPLGLDDHRRRRIERSKLEGDHRQNDGNRRRAASGQQAGGDASADRLQNDERHHVADAERMARDECEPRKRRGRAERDDDERARPSDLCHAKRNQRNHPGGTSREDQRAAQTVQAEPDLRGREASDRQGPGSQARRTRSRRTTAR